MPETLNASEIEKINNMCPAAAEAKLGTTLSEYATDHLIATLAEGQNLVLGTTTGSQIGTAAAQKLGFHGATAVVQRVGSAQAAVVTTAATSTSPFGFSEVQANAIVTLVNEIRSALVAKGLIKGAA